MELLTDGAQVYLDGKDPRRTFKLYKDGSAERHRVSDDVTLTRELIRGLNAPLGPGKTSEGGGVYRFWIDDGMGRLVYKLGVDGPDSAAIFHYHWNYNLNLPLTA